MRINYTPGFVAKMERKARFLEARFSDRSNSIQYWAGY
jgi:hypothetical protein